MNEEPPKCSEDNKSPNAPDAPQELTGFGALAGCGVILLAAMVCAFDGPLGAQAGGLHEGGWNTQFIPPFLGGGYAGLILSTVTIVAARAAKAGTALSLVLGFIVPVVLTILGAAAFYALR